MSDVNPEKQSSTPSREPADILRSTQEIIATVAPQLKNIMGALVLDKVLSPYLKHTLDGIKSDIDALIESYNDEQLQATSHADVEDVTYDPPLEREDDTSSSDVLLADLPDSALASSDETETIKARVADSNHDASSPAESGLVIDKIVLETAEHVNQSPNETCALRDILIYLQNNEGKYSLAALTTVAFGVTKLPREEEKKLKYLLDSYAQKGILDRYGKSYELGANLEVATVKADDTTSKILEHLSKLGENGDSLNIGQIVRSYFGVERVNKEIYDDFISHLNELVERQSLVHRGGPWYCLAGTQEVENIEPVETFILTESIGYKVMQQEVESTATPSQEESEVTNPGIDTTGEAKDSAPMLPNIDELSEREQLILRIMLQSTQEGIFFRPSELDFSAIEGEFKDKRAFAVAYSALATKLINKGILIDNGVARGGRKVAFQKGSVSTTLDQNSLATETKSERQSSSAQPKFYDDSAQPLPSQSAASDELVPKRPSLFEARKKYSLAPGF